MTAIPTPPTCFSVVFELAFHLCADRVPSGSIDLTHERNRLQTYLQVFTSGTGTATRGNKCTLLVFHTDRPKRSTLTTWPDWYLPWVDRNRLRKVFGHKRTSLPVIERVLGCRWLRSLDRFGGHRLRCVSSRPHSWVAAGR